MAQPGLLCARALGKRAARRKKWRRLRARAQRASRTACEWRRWAARALLTRACELAWRADVGPNYRMPEFSFTPPPEGFVTWMDQRPCVGSLVAVALGGATVLCFWWRADDMLTQLWHINNLTRLKAILDANDNVNIFISEGAGVKDIVAKMEAEGKEVARDAFGHVKLDSINPGKYFADTISAMIGAEKVLVQKSGYYARAAPANTADLKLIKQCCELAVECAVSRTSGALQRVRQAWGTENSLGISPAARISRRPRPHP